MSDKQILVTLKNGSQEMLQAVNGIMSTLDCLRERNPMHIYELAMVCKDSTHQCWNGIDEDLKKRSLMMPDGRVHATIKNIINSAVIIDGSNISIVDPKVQENE